MEFPGDTFDDVLLASGQLQEQSQQPPSEQTQKEIEQEERARERQRQIQEEIDELTALGEWDDRVRLVENLRAQIQVIFSRGIADLERYRQTLSPVDDIPPSERHDLDRIIGAIWPASLDMDTAETESDADESELRLTRDPPSTTSRPTYSPAERSALATDYDSDSDGPSEDELPSAPTPESTRSANTSASEAEPNVNELASTSNSSLGTIGTTVFNMEFE